MSDRHDHPITDGIRRAIRDDGRTPFELAKLANIGPQQLYRFLNGKRGLSLEVLDKLAVVVGAEVRKVGEVVQVSSTITVPVEAPVSTVPNPGGLLLRSPGLSPFVRGKPGVIRASAAAPGTRPITATMREEAMSGGSRRPDHGQARRAGQRRRMQIEGLGPGVLEFYLKLDRKDRPPYYKLLDAMFGYDLPGPHSRGWYRRADGIQEIVLKRPEVISWLWDLPPERRVTASRALDPEAVPEDEASFRRWAEALEP
ncbi:helix-turn-helix domain-containing protein [Tundrisphaera sp. TA3]|uniref:helix-turn-helix domain-containing protein n=1 Tax=Tundrisphaera sp. TA3 TaxID=3435775 RepID=UPI003EB87053